MEKNKSLFNKEKLSWFLYLVMSGRPKRHYNPGVTFLILLVQVGLDVWRRERRGGRILGHMRNREFLYLLENGNNPGPTVCLKLKTATKLSSLSSYRGWTDTAQEQQCKVKGEKKRN